MEEPYSGGYFVIATPESIFRCDTLLVDGKKSSREYS